MDGVQSLGSRELTTIDHRTIPISRLLQSQVRTAYLDYLFSRKEEEA